MRTVLVSVEGLPDAIATLHDDDSIEISVTGLTGLVARPRDPSREETEAGILTADPPTIRTSDRRQLELLVLRAVEIAIPDGLLDNVAGIDREQLLLVQIGRLVRRLMWKLEPPE